MRRDQIGSLWGLRTRVWLETSESSMSPLTRESPIRYFCNRTTKSGAGGAKPAVIA